MVCEEWVEASLEGLRLGAVVPARTMIIIIYKLSSTLSPRGRSAKFRSRKSSTESSPLAQLRAVNDPLRKLAKLTMSPRR